MFKKIKLILIIFLFINFFSLLSAEENFFDEAKNKFNEKKLEDSKTNPSIKNFFDRAKKFWKN